MKRVRLQHWLGGRGSCRAESGARRLGRSLALPTLALTLLLGCEGEKEPYDYRMVYQPKYDTMDPSPFWPDGSSARPPVPGTVSVDGVIAKVPVFPVEATRSTQRDFPFPLERSDIERGQKLYNIYCAVCHGATGKGDGMIARRGFTRPPSFYLPRLRNAPHGHFYDVITNGYGAMYSYNDRVSPDDRWRITGYVRALQLSDPTDQGLYTPPAQRR
jgi:mono/diheme cytochrome c family protein